MADRREYLFVSYATEDWPLAEWLTLRLTAEGYRVWCDRFQLLGGMSFPRDVDRAIKEKTFRLIALLSKHSKDKPNPVKERTLAHAIGRERGEDFLIPIKVDGIRPIELGWMESDLNYVSFHRDWPGGFGALLHTLRALDTPRQLDEGRAAACDWMASRDVATERPEQLWSNLIPILTIPEALLLIEPASVRKINMPSDWPHVRRNDGTFWAFEVPGCRGINAQVTEILWRDQRIGRQSLNHIATQLLNQHLRSHCLRLGMLENADGHLYFPVGLLPDDRIHFRRFDGRQTWVLCTGERTFRTTAERERVRYYLSPTLRATVDKYGFPCIDIHLRVHLTTTDNQPLPTYKAVRRRKRICKNWWNYHWLARTSAVVQWMASGEEVFSIAGDPERPIVVSGTPLSFSARAGIHEDRALQSAQQLERADALEVEDEDA